MLYYIEVTQEWCGDIEAENEYEALEIAETCFSQQDVNTSIVILRED